MKLWKVYTLEENNIHLTGEMEEYEKLYPFLWEVESVNKDWDKSLYLELDPIYPYPNHSDFLNFSVSFLIVSPEALEMFNKIDKNAFEVLDFICGCGKYYIINIIKIVDCIDMEKSVYKTYKMDPDTIVKYKKLFFKWDNIKDNKIFWLKHLEGGLLVCTDEVKNQIENAHLYGLGFELLGEN